ncbi:hypothetical protein DFP72DRAFT_283900 [Ephemerocybe angulata]|uniref:Uncharacterized protein n=1 Tax=Ephemerocybe angulata TaxID=980116 RepID=A0A8H6I0E9_9AGAR|nr:hypothetical protein DFP72DRAFT_283900 [Tulosesus angulatus]
MNPFIHRVGGLFIPSFILSFFTTFTVFTYIDNRHTLFWIFAILSPAFGFWVWARRGAASGARSDAGGGGGGLGGRSGWSQVEWWRGGADVGRRRMHAKPKSLLFFLIDVYSSFLIFPLLLLLLCLLSRLLRFQCCLA